jgi:site-specific DNA-cytosine methylase
MDYRTEHSATVDELRSILQAISQLSADTVQRRSNSKSDADKASAAIEAASKMLERIDGSLPLRLLLENISGRLGYEHHLLKDSYLAKRDGQHGDWLARMDPRRPSKTMVSHMSKDTYAFVHPFSDRTISVREAARIQGFPDWFSFGEASLTEAFKMIGNAVPPFLSHELASRLAAALTRLHRPELKIVVQTAGRN